MKSIVLKAPFLGFILLLALFALSRCVPGSRGLSQQEKTESEALARVFCASCHQYPEPEYLDKKTWEQYVLPRMGYMLGIYPSDTLRPSLIEAGVGAEERAELEKVFPPTPQMPVEFFEKITRYYLAMAPDTLPRATDKKIDRQLARFEANIPELQLKPPSTTFVRFSNNRIFLGDAITQKIYLLDPSLQVRNSATVQEGLVWMNEREDDLVLTIMGSFSPTDAASGKILSLPNKPGLKPRVLVDKLQRPVHADLGDLNQDGLDDLVVCEFAKWTGGLSWWENLGNDQYREHLLRDKPGAIKSYIRDMDADGRADVVALFSQGDEGIFIFYNQGGGVFREERVLPFHPSYGSSYFNLTDFNGDGFLDIVYTNGDNADYPPVLKYYHGIRLFENDGTNHFREVLFYHLNGAYGAIPADFDLDGDLDIAAISFFPDYRNCPEESFVYLENQGDFQFQPYTFQEVNLGRWIVMDAADYDQDGDLDLALGALTFEVIPNDLGYVEKWMENGVPFVLLKNQTRKSP